MPLLNLFQQLGRGGLGQPHGLPPGPVGQWQPPPVHLPPGVAPLGPWQQAPGDLVALMQQRHPGLGIVGGKAKPIQLQMWPDPGGPTGLLARDPIFGEVRYLVLGEARKARAARRPGAGGLLYPYHDPATGAVVDLGFFGGRWMEGRWYPRRRHFGIFPPHLTHGVAGFGDPDVPDPRVIGQPYFALPRRVEDLRHGPKMPFTPMVGPPGTIRLPGGHLVRAEEMRGMRAPQFPGWAYPGGGWYDRATGMAMLQWMGLQPGSPLAPREIRAMLNPILRPTPGEEQWYQRKAERYFHMQEQMVRGEQPTFSPRDILAGMPIPWHRRGEGFKYVPGRGTFIRYGIGIGLNGMRIAEPGWVPLPPEGAYRWPPDPHVDQPWRPKGQQVIPPGGAIGPMPILTRRFGGTGAGYYIQHQMPQIPQILQQQPIQPPQPPHPAPKGKRWVYRPPVGPGPVIGGERPPHPAPPGMRWVRR